MPNAGSITKQVYPKNSAHILAKQNIQCGAPRTKWDAVHLASCKEKKIEVDWAYQQNATDIHSKSSHALGTAGNRRKGRPKETRRRSVEQEMNALGWSWGHIAKLAADRPRWRSSVSALCESTPEED